MKLIKNLKGRYGIDGKFSAIHYKAEKVPYGISCSLAFDTACPADCDYCSLTLRRKGEKALTIVKSLKEIANAINVSHASHLFMNEEADTGARFNVFVKTMELYRMIKVPMVITTKFPMNLIRWGLPKDVQILVSLTNGEEHGMEEKPPSLQKRIEGINLLSSAGYPVVPRILILKKNDISVLRDAYLQLKDLAEFPTIISMFRSGGIFNKKRMPWLKANFQGEIEEHVNGEWKQYHSVGYTLKRSTALEMIKIFKDIPNAVFDRLPWKSIIPKGQLFATKPVDCMVTAKGHCLGTPRVTHTTCSCTTPGKNKTLCPRITTLNSEDTKFLTNRWKEATSFSTVYKRNTLQRLLTKKPIGG